MNTDRTFKVDIGSEIDRLFNDSSLSNGTTPEAIVLMGGVASGKTTLRKSKYSSGFVVIDAAEMFHHMSSAPYLDFPEALLEPLELIGPLVAKRAVSERRHIVTEIIGAESVPTGELIEALKSAGYYVELVYLTCDLQESIRRSQERGDNISAYYAEPFQRRWLINACAKLVS